MRITYDGADKDPNYEYKPGDRIVTKKKFEGKLIHAVIHSIWFGAGDNMKVIPNGETEPKYTCIEYWKLDK